MSLRRSKPLTIALGVIVALIWANGIRVFIDAYYSDDYDDILPQKNQQTGSRPTNTATGGTKKINASDDVQNFQSRNRDSSPKTQNKSNLSLVSKEKLARLELKNRNPFQYYLKPRKVAKPKKKNNGIVTDYQKVETVDPSAKDPGPGLRLIGIVQGEKSAALLLSKSGKKKLVYENQEFELNTVVKIESKKIIVDHISGRSYVIDRVGWRPIKKQ